MGPQECVPVTIPRLIFLVSNDENKSVRRRRHKRDRWKCLIVRASSDLPPLAQMHTMNSPTTSPEKWLSRMFVATILSACALMISQRLIDPDLWGHIQYGEDWVAEGARPRVASHTYAAPDCPWVHHENLSELALAFGHRAVGGLGITTTILYTRWISIRSSAWRPRVLDKSTTLRQSGGHVVERNQ